MRGAQGRTNGDVNFLQPFTKEAIQAEANLMIHVPPLRIQQLYISPVMLPIYCAFIISVNGKGSLHMLLLLESTLIYMHSCSCFSLQIIFEIGK